MNCPNCDKKVNEDDRFCVCGVQLWSDEILNTWNNMESLSKIVQG